MEHVIHRLFANLFMNEYLLLTSLFTSLLHFVTFLLCLLFQLCSWFYSLLYFLTLSAAFSRSALDLL